MREKNVPSFGLSCRLFSAWKIVGMTVTSNRCDVKRTLPINVFEIIYLFMGVGVGGQWGLVYKYLLPARLGMDRYMYIQVHVQSFGVIHCVELQNDN